MVDIFNTAKVPLCSRTATISPIPKPSVASDLSDRQPVALTLMVMKGFERLVTAHIKDGMDPTADPQQYAYRADPFITHQTLAHLENRGSYVRMFLDFSLAFNATIPQTLINKLLSLGLSPTMSNRVLDLQTNRPQSIRIHNLPSSAFTVKVT